MNSLDNILAGGESASEGKTETEQVTQQTVTEGEGQTEQQTEGQTTEGEGYGQKMVPHQALHAERAKVKRYTEEVSEFRKQLADSNAAWERRVAQILEAQKPPAPAQAPPDWFENPTEAMRHQLTQQVSPAFEQFGQQLQAIAKDNAIVRFTEEKVNEAEQAFLTAMNNRSLDPADYQRVTSSPNRYAAAVQWHQRQQAQKEIGDDPAAYKTRLREELKAELLAEQQQGNGGSQQQQTAVTPSNLASARNVGGRSGPAWSGPSPLQDIFDRRTPNG